MKYFKVIILMLGFSASLSYALDFKITPSNKIDDTIYFSHEVKSESMVKAIDVGLEGNASDAEIKQHYTFSCDWGNAYGIRLSMNSSSMDGPFAFDNIYVLDEKLNIFFAKSHGRINKKWIDPLSLKSAVCKHSSGGIQNDPITKKDYIVDFEVMQFGSFVLKGIDDVTIKYVRNDTLNLVREDVGGEVVVDAIKNHDNMAPLVSTVFL
ncbi:hypothetical protein N7563_20035 [Leclercia adecarboxylata ATCC 23216 = NBRC 102595]|nr:hypothetical protein [Leclercia adecarboxylata ATCC 23216 = NBRC 102595]